MTPQKPKPSASGQLPHASPNPFSVTPRKKANGESSAGPIFETSPFIHNSSPKKYKEVLDAYSRARGAGPGSVEITPRTKARKRLAGELEATPAKVPRRQRRDRPTATGTAAAAPPPPPPPVRRAGSDWEDEYDDDDEEFGETPAKPGVPAFGLDAGLASGTKSKPKGLLPLFQSVKRAAEEAGGRDAKRRAVNGAKAELEYDFDAEAPEAPGSPSPRVSPNANRLPTPPPYSPPPIERTQQQQPKSRTQTRTRVVKFSGNEWDPAADTRSVCVRGTRRAAIRVAPDAGLASDDEESAAEEKEAEAAEDIGEDEDEEDEEDNADGARDAAPLMSFLSLRSPIARKGERLADLRVRALLDPTSAAAVALRAARRGQEVFVCGEVDGEGDEWELDVDVAAAEGDDDWESDPEGWKAAPDDDDW
jgi:hypothetical protein